MRVSATWPSNFVPTTGKKNKRRTTGPCECQAFGARARRSLAAIVTRSARESAFIFRNPVIRSLAIEYAREGIRFNAVAPGAVDTPMHKDDPKDFLKTLQPMGKIASVKDVVEAVLYLAQAGQVTGEVLHVDGGSHAGRW
jgi:Enoyl-(Acyl carrier protein) reductase